MDKDKNKDDIMSDSKRQELAEMARFNLLNDLVEECLDLEIITEEQSDEIVINNFANEPTAKNFNSIMKMLQAKKSKATIGNGNINSVSKPMKEKEEEFVIDPEESARIRAENERIKKIPEKERDLS